MNLKILLALSVSWLLIAAAAFSQAPATPDNPSEQAALTKQAAAAGPAASPAPTVAVEPPSLIPANILPGANSEALPQMPSAPELEKLNELFKRTTLGKTADEHRLHVQMAALEVGIRNDEDLHALKAVAFQAPTDLERRDRLKTYYQAYYAKLQARAGTPDLKDYLKTQQAVHELLLLQPRTRHEMDEAEAATLAQTIAGTAAGALPAPSQAPVNDILPNN